MTSYYDIVFYHIISATLRSCSAAGDGSGGAAFVLEDEDDAVPNNADLNFIDDEGVALEDQVDFGDDVDLDGPGGLNYDEAEEAEDDLGDELDRMFGRKRRQESGAEAENQALVEDLMSQMEVAVEEDLAAFENRRPAVHKLRMLGRVQEVLAMKKLHNELLDSGILGVMKAWIDPMPDGTLPNSKVRGTVLSLLQRLPVDCSYEDRKEQLKRSGLGKVVMFLSKLPDETPENRRTARDLVERWSRPILAPQGAPAVDEEESQRILHARQQRQRDLQEKTSAEGVGADDADDETRVLRPGDDGFRFHATIPQAASLDYVRRPESKAAMVISRGGSKGGEHKIKKKLETMGKKSSRRATNVSVEGRNMNVLK